MPDVEKNDPETENVWYQAFDKGLVGGDTDFVIHRDERGIIRVVQRTMKSPIIERLDDGLER
jgi:hypothetical protein